MKKGLSLEQILLANGLKASDLADVLGSALFNQEHIVKGKNNEEDEQPAIVLTLQENANPQKKGWEPRLIEGDFTAFIVHKGEGNVETGLAGAISHPLDFLVIAEALDKLRDKVLKEGIKYIENRL